MDKKILWLVFFVFLISIAIFFIIGVVTSLNITTSSQSSDVADPSSETTPDKTSGTFKDINNINILVLGDSIGAGMGDETNAGLGKGYAAKMRDTGKETEVINLSVPGAKTADLLERIQNKETEEFLSKSHLIMVSIGGNDINNLLDAESLSLASDYEALMTQYLSDLKVILNDIRAKNEDAQIVFIGVYNPYGDKVGIEKLELLLNMNDKTSLLVNSYPNSVYIPTYDLYKYNLNSFLAVDDFHPNAAGYSAIVDRIVAVLGDVN